MKIEIQCVTAEIDWVIHVCECRSRILLSELLAVRKKVSFPPYTRQWYNFLSSKRYANFKSIPSERVYKFDQIDTDPMQHSVNGCNVKIYI